MSDEATVTDTPPTPDTPPTDTPTEAPGLPSAEDLDAVAAETPAEPAADAPEPEDDDSDDDGETDDEDEVPA